MRRKWLCHLIVLVALVILALIALDQRMIVRTYTVESDKIEEPVRLVVLADFHGCDYGEDGAELVQAVVELQPDVVLLGGDIFDDALPWDASETLVRSLAQRWPCYYVTGNHEYWSERIDEICRIITDAGATVLNMDCRTINVRGQRLNICGVLDPYAMVYDDAPDTQTQLTRALAECELDVYTILLAHRPELIDQYAAAGFDLVASGHAHGGQVRIPFLVNGLYAPNQGWFPPYAGGRYEVNGTTLIVSRGLARESTRLPRIFNRPELLLVELCPLAQ